jgi:ABC-type Zn uptake system ZnuABC Zn-binding protein ZnuA
MIELAKGREYKKEKKEQIENGFCKILREQEYFYQEYVKQNKLIDNLSTENINKANQIKILQEQIKEKNNELIKVCNLFEETITEYNNISIQEKKYLSNEESIIEEKIIENNKKRKII